MTNLGYGLRVGNTVYTFPLICDVEDEDTKVKFLDVLPIINEVAGEVLDHFNNEENLVIDGVDVELDMILEQIRIAVRDALDLELGEPMVTIVGLDVTAEDADDSGTEG